MVVRIRGLQLIKQGVLLMSISFFRRAALATAITALTACGGGGGGSDGGSAGPIAPSVPVVPASPSTPSNTGVLTDSAVGGVRYTTSSGYSGTTDAAGHFLYNAGETVTFKIGELTLGTIAPTGTAATITPIELATANGVTDPDKVTNLLVLLQSLDNDGDASNGITITSPASTALTTSVAATINLAADPAVFIADSALSGVVAQVGGAAKVVPSVNVAKEHFKQEFLAKLTGTWMIEPNGEAIVFRFDASGNYIMGEYAKADDDGQSGIERGLIGWSPTTGEITASDIVIDTNGEWGLSHPNGEHLYFAFENDTLLLTIKAVGKADEVMRWSRVAAVTSGDSIVGTWGLDDGNRFDKAQFVFLGDGRYFMLDTVGDDEYSEPDDPKCGGEGLELGHYALTGATLTFSGIVVDTNGCAGGHHIELDGLVTYEDPLTLTVDNGIGKATIIGGRTFYRAGVAGPLP
jgi:hypothetical protein